MPAPIAGSAGAPGGQSGLGSGGGRKPAAPGVYTQMIRESSTPSPELPGTKPVAAAPAPKARTIPLGLIIALNVVLVLAIVLILYFVFRPSPPAAAPDAAAESDSTSAPALTKPGLTKPALTKPAVPKPALPKAPIPLPK